MDFHRHAQRDKKLESPKEKAMAPHSSTPAWKIPWTEGPGRLQSMGSLRVRHDWATSLSLFTFIHWRRKWQPTPVFLPGELRDRGAWWAAVYGVAQSWTRLKRLSSSSSKEHPELRSNKGMPCHLVSSLLKLRAFPPIYLVPHFCISVLFVREFAISNGPQE